MRWQTTHFYTSFWWFLVCRRAHKFQECGRMPFWHEAALVEWYLNDVLLNDLPLWNDDMLWGALPAAQPCKRATPGRRERAAERHLHPFPAGHLTPLPRLSLQTLDSLEKDTTRLWCEMSRDKKDSCVAAACIINHRWHREWMTVWLTCGLRTATKEASM